MKKRYFFLIFSIMLCCNGLIVTAQTPGFETLVAVEEGYVVGAEIVGQLIIFSMGDPLPEEAHIFTLSYDPGLLALDTDKGVNGVEANTIYTQLEIDSSIPGEVTIEIVFAEHLNTFTLYFISLRTGTSPIGITTAVPDIYNNATIDIKVVDYGDVNGDYSIDILDALLTAQKYVGMIVHPFIESAADVNCDQNIDIVDALLMAQYYVGLISEFPLCNGNPTPVTTPQPTPVYTPTIIPGDVNGSGSVDLVDCLLVYQYLSGLTPDPFIFEAADVNHDGVITEADAMVICNFEIIID